MNSMTQAITAVRQDICTACDRRPPGSELLPASEPRECEARCDLFLHLPRIARVVLRFGGEPPCGYDAALQSLSCTECTAVPRSPCADPCPRPLSRYATEAAALIERFVRGQPIPDDASIQG